MLAGSHWFGDREMTSCIRRNAWFDTGCSLCVSHGVRRVLLARAVHTWKVGIISWPSICLVRCRGVAFPYSVVRQWIQFGVRLRRLREEIYTFPTCRWT